MFSHKSQTKLTKTAQSLAIIAAVKPRIPLWDAFHSMRKNGSFLWSLWNAVADEVGEDAEEVRCKWKKLRSYYMTCYKQHIKTGTRPTWQFYKSLSFLSDMIAKVLKEEEEQKAFNKKWNLDHSGMRVDDITVLDDDQVFIISSPDNDQIDPQEPIKLEKDFVLEEETISPESSLIDIPPAADEIIDPLEVIQPRKRRNVLASPLATTSATSSDGTNQKSKNCHTTEVENEPATSSTDGWLAIERRKLELLEKETAEEMNPDLSFFKSLIPIMKMFSEPQKLRVRVAINQIILREYSQVKAKAVANGFNVEQ